MKEKTGFVAYNERELEIWSMTLALNELIYFIQIDEIDGKIVYLLYADKVDDKKLKLLLRQYELQIGCMTPKR